MIRLQLLILFVLISFQIKSQTAYSGILIDNKSNDPISYANVFYQNNQRIGTMSNGEGKFVL